MKFNYYPETDSLYISLSDNSSVDSQEIIPNIVLDFDIEGKFLSVYSNYEINPAFEKGTFNKVVIKYDSSVDKRPKAYWDTIRPVPLNQEEIKDYHVKDSLFLIAQDSIKRNDNIDSLRKHQGKLTLNSILMSGINRNHYGRKSRYEWGMDPLL